MVEVHLVYNFELGIPTIIPDYFEKALLSGKLNFNIKTVYVSALALNHKLHEIIKLLKLIKLYQLRNGY